MSLALLHHVPAGAIEMLSDDQNQPLFNRADLGKYLGIEKIRDNFKDSPSHYAHPRSVTEGPGLTSSGLACSRVERIFMYLLYSMTMMMSFKT